MVNPVFSNRKTSDPDEEKELNHPLDGLNNGPHSLTDDQARQFMIRSFQPKRHRLLQTLGEKLHLRNSQLAESAAPKIETPSSPTGELKG